MLRKFLIASSFLFAFTGVIQAQSSDKATLTAKFGKGVNFTAADNSFHLKFEARFQTLFEGKYNLKTTEDPFKGDFMIRRARLKFSGFAFKPGIEYKVELGLSNRDLQVTGKDSDYSNMILDAYMRFKLAKNLKLRVGQFKMPGNRERVVSSGSLQLVDRSLVNSRFNLDRDAGIMLEHMFNIGTSVFKEYVSISTGEGRNRMGNDAGFMYAGRVEFLPFGEFKKKGDIVMSAISREEKPRLSIGVSTSYNDNAKRARGQLGNFLFESRDLITLNTDFIFKWGGFSAYGEYGNRMTKAPVTSDIENIDFEPVYAGQGFNIQSGYMFKNNWEIAGRFTSLHPDAKIADFADQQTDYTVGLSKFIEVTNSRFRPTLPTVKPSLPFPAELLEKTLSSG